MLPCGKLIYRNKIETEVHLEANDQRYGRGISSLD